MQPGEQGEVWYTEKPNGRIQARVRVCGLDGIIREVAGSGADQTEARSALFERLKIRAAQDGGGLGDRSSIPFADVAHMWLDARKRSKTVRASTIAQYRSTLEQILLPELGEIRMGDVTRLSLNFTLKRIAEGHRTGYDRKGKPRKGRPITGKQPRVVLTMICQWAWDEGYLDHHPLAERGKSRNAPAAVDPDTDEETPDTVRVLTDTEVEALGTLLEMAEKPSPRGGTGSKPDLREICGLMLGTGMRIGEAVALRWSDCDLDGSKPLIRITGTAVLPRGEDVPKMRRGRPKTAEGYRHIIPSDDVVAMLRNRRERAKFKSADDYVFASETGTMLWPNNLRTKLRAVTKGTSLAGITPHVFRKTFATRLRDARGPEAAQRALGHANLDVTEESYLARRIEAVDVRVRNRPGILPKPDWTEDAARKAAYREWLEDPNIDDFEVPEGPSPLTDPHFDWKTWVINHEASPVNIRSVPDVDETGRETG